MDSHAPESVSSIYTLGSSNRTPEEFIQLLNHYCIRALVDVRRFPTSKFSHFKKESLAKLLTSSHIDYVYLGDLLGGYRRKGYEAYTESNEFREGLKKLESLGSKKSTAVMCAERLPWRCHRRFIGKHLESRGWRIIHIIDEKRVWEPGEG